MKSSSSVVLKFFTCALFAGFLASCATPSDPAAMTPSEVSVRHRSSRSVGVNVTGGRETNPMWTSQVSSSAFQEALETSVQRHGVFSKVIRSGGADYELDVVLVGLKQPFAGLNMTVSAEIDWSLKTGAGRVVWRRTTTKSFTATVGDSFSGVNRLRLANEGAIRENIKAGLEGISALDL